MKTHRMYRHQREEVPCILVLEFGVNYVPEELMRKAGLFEDPYKAPEQVSEKVDNNDSTTDPRPTADSH